MSTDSFSQNMKPTAHSLMLNARQAIEAPYLAEATTILVEGLPHMATKADLYSYFSRFGEVKYCVMVPLEYELNLSSSEGAPSPYFNHPNLNKRALFQVVEKDVAQLIVHTQNFLQNTPIYCSLVSCINQAITHLFDEIAIYFGFIIFKYAQTRDYVLSCGPFRIHNKLVRCVPFDAQLDCINGEKRAAASESVKDTLAELPTTNSPDSSSLASNTHNSDKLVRACLAGIQFGQQADSAEVYQICEQFISIK